MGRLMSPSNNVYTHLEDVIVLLEEFFMKTIKQVVNGRLYSTENGKKVGEYAAVDRSDFS